MTRITPTAALILSALASLSIGACSSGSSGPTVSPAAQQEADNIFTTRCATCHGASGGGDGTASAGLTPKPRNFQLASWQSSVTDQHIASIIVGGGPAVGKSPAMPPNPDLQAKPEIVNGLVAHVRRLGQ